jgi:4-aminobutyrate aminotransferase-like enzyme
MDSRLLQTGLNAGKIPPVSVVGGEGVYFLLDDGRKVIDGSNTGGPLGHAHPEIVEAVTRASHAPVINEGWLWAEREEAAAELIETAFAGEDWVGAVRFALSGSEANDLALSLAQAITGRGPLVTRERAYHGMVGLAREMTVQPHWHGGLSKLGGGVQPVPRSTDVRVIPAPVGAKYGGVAAAPLRERLTPAPERLAGSAAAILDYTQGGIYYDPEYQDAVAGAARDAGTLWIADEVVTGLGRSGRWFAFQGAQSRPDIVTLGKPLAGGGAPAGAIVLSKNLVESLGDKSWQTYSTFRGHPISIAAARAHLRIVARDGLIDRVAKLEGVMHHVLVDIAQRHPSVARVDGYGLHWTIELHGPDWRTWYADTDALPAASLVAARALAAGALIGTSGERTSLFIAPPLTIADDELDRLLSALDVGLAAADELLEA